MNTVKAITNMVSPFLEEGWPKGFGVNVVSSNKTKIAI
jgi:hypothetical protein